MRILKFWSLSEDKKSLILLPSKVGIEIIKKHLTEKNIKFTEGVEKIGSVSLIALIISLSASCRFIESKLSFPGVLSLYVFMENEDKLYIVLPYEI